MKRRSFVVPNLLLGLLFAAACTAGSGEEQRASPLGQPDDPAQGDSLGSEQLDEETVRLLEKRYEERLALKPFTAIEGQVHSVDGSAVVGATVSAGGHSAKTDARGHFVLDELPYGQYLVSINHPAFVFTQRAVGAEYASQPFLDAVVMPRSKARVFNADENTVINEGSLKLTFEPGDLVFDDTGAPVHGNVELVASVVEPGRDKHIDAAPAPLEGRETDGSFVALESFGMFELELTQGGRQLQVRKGEQVEMELGLPAERAAKAGGSIPLWHHDTKLGIWVREGELAAAVDSKGAKAYARAELPHFSSWNLDLGNPTICVKVLFPGALGFKAISTTATGALDNLWSMTGECQGIGRCAGMAPSAWSGAASVTFKFQVQLPGLNGTPVWCDMPVVMQMQNQTTIDGYRLRDYAVSIDNAAPQSNYCGSYNGTYGDIAITGAYNAVYVQSTPVWAVPLEPADLNGDTNLTPADVLNCTGTPQIWGGYDQGFGKMAVNARNTLYFNDFDRDGSNDGKEKCPASSNNLACASYCYVAPGTPNAALYDPDGDRIDSGCDSKSTIFNPSQYNDK